MARLLQFPVLTLVLCGLAIGCDDRGGAAQSPGGPTPGSTAPATSPTAPAAPTATPGSGDDLNVVRTVLAEHFKRQPAEVRPEMTFADLGADELDLVEAVMKIEERLKIQIRDGAVDRAAGASSPKDALGRLTVAKLAGVVTEARVNPRK